MPRYSDTLMEHFTSPSNQGQLDDADRVGLSGVIGRGRYVVIYLKLDSDRVTDVRFRSQGCGPTIASASILTEMVGGKTLTECGSITAQQIIDGLDGLPADKHFCAGVALDALKRALEQ